MAECRWAASLAAFIVVRDVMVLMSAQDQKRCHVKKLGRIVLGGCMIARIVLIVLHVYDCTDSQTAQSVTACLPAQRA